MGVPKTAAASARPRFLLVLLLLSLPSGEIALSPDSVVVTRCGTSADQAYSQNSEPFSFLEFNGSATTTTTTPASTVATGCACAGSVVLGSLASFVPAMPPYVVAPCYDDPLFSNSDVASGSGKRFIWRLNSDGSAALLAALTPSGGSSPGAGATVHAALVDPVNPNTLWITVRKVQSSAPEGLVTVATDGGVGTMVGTFSNSNPRFLVAGYAASGSLVAFYGAPADTSSTLNRYISTNNFTTGADSTVKAQSGTFPSGAPTFTSDMITAMAYQPVGVTTYGWFGRSTSQNPATTATSFSIWVDRWTKSATPDYWSFNTATDPHLQIGATSTNKLVLTGLAVQRQPDGRDYLFITSGYVSSAASQGCLYRMLTASPYTVAQINCESSVAYTGVTRVPWAPSATPSAGYTAAPTPPFTTTASPVSLGVDVLVGISLRGRRHAYSSIISADRANLAFACGAPALGAHLRGLPCPP